MLQIHQAIVHVLDYRSGVTVYSEETMDVESEVVQGFLKKHLLKCLEDGRPDRERVFARKRLCGASPAISGGEAVLSGFFRSDRPGGRRRAVQGGAFRFRRPDRMRFRAG